MVDLLRDMEVLLASDRHFLLGPWLKDAVSWAGSKEEEMLLQWNARNQITIWGPEGEVRGCAVRSTQEPLYYCYYSETCE
jgi:alpha-N-acetylglucosaminidase